MIVEPTKWGSGFTDGWNKAIEAAIMNIPDGQTCDPQQVADSIRELLITPNPEPEENE